MLLVVEFHQCDGPTPTIMWWGWGHILKYVIVDVKVFIEMLKQKLSFFIFFPTHWPLGQDPPKRFLFRV